MALIFPKAYLFLHKKNVRDIYQVVFVCFIYKAFVEFFTIINFLEYTFRNISNYNLVVFSNQLGNTGRELAHPPQY